MSRASFYGLGNKYSYKAASDTNSLDGDDEWHVNAWEVEKDQVDNKNGIPTDGVYQYRVLPKIQDFDSLTHSPIIGYAFDGYPIYGPYGYSNPFDTTSKVIRMTSSYHLRNITKRDSLKNGEPVSYTGPDISTRYPLGYFIEDYEFIKYSGTLDKANG